MADPEAGILGYPTMPGRSPANLYRGGLPDWISEADAGARVVSISRKDRSAIGFAGRAAGEVYWMTDPVAGFITSSHYRSEYPDWVLRFNREVMPGIYSDTVWESRVPEEAARLARTDTSDYERGGRSGVFPHRPSQAAVQANPAALTVWRFETPAPDAGGARSRTCRDRGARARPTVRGGLPGSVIFTGGPHRTPLRALQR